ncbi:hypothetical protein BDY17DRAFT_116715 [Neohortaea acidophila]|uniref:Uncharacterized protein n=1 Tax=Neohortaea acidophila TaxID=245834 RepID=A0A6A6PVS6_9PEZI|nr:uncharacterized protein BDY17DRAFT_116715 [Neohortaea acidophila]KAF2483844.1 hypothetical protein BDY17DRAFT_116715 [Neohortaea acidophila]
MESVSSRGLGHLMNSYLVWNVGVGTHYGTVFAIDQGQATIQKVCCEPATALYSPTCHSIPVQCNPPVLRRKPPPASITPFGTSIPPNCPIAMPPIEVQPRAM